MWWIILIIVLIIVSIAVLLVTIRHLRRNKALSILQMQSRSLSDDIVQKAVLQSNYRLHFIANEEFFDQKVISAINSTVWGRGIMVFTYQFPAALDYQYDEGRFREIIKEELNKEATQRQLKPFKKVDPFVVTDSWLFANHLNLEIAFVINQPTLDYVSDLQKMKAHNG